MKTLNEILNDEGIEVEDNDFQEMEHQLSGIYFGEPEPTDKDFRDTVLWIYSKVCPVSTNE